MSTVILGHTDHAGEVLGVHGGDGVMYWARLATGSHLYAEWDGIEWVAFDKGGRAGRHIHSHTEEIWYFLSGTARIELDGEYFDVGPGSLVLTPLQSSHALWNTGDGRVEYIVIEVFPPEISAALPPRRPTEEDNSGTGVSTQRRGEAF